MDRIENEDVQKALATILADDKFAVAPQMSAFLAYVVAQTLAGNADRIKAYTVAVDALGKPPTFDPQNDPSVRVLAKRMRSSLDAYYERTTGHDVIIEIKCGSYKPNFLRAMDKTAEPGADAPVTSAHTTARSNQTIQTAAHEHVRSQNLSGNQYAASPVVSLNQKHGDPVTVLSNPPLPQSPPSQSLTQEVKTTQAISAGPQHHSIPTSTNRVTTLDSSIADKTASDSLPDSSNEWLSMKKIPGPVMALAALSALVWALSGNHGTDTAAQDVVASNVYTDATLDSPSFRIEMASDTRSAPIRPRPDIPTLFVRSIEQGKSIHERLSVSMISVFSRFDSVQDSQQLGTEFWPEEYVLTVDSLAIDDSLQVSTQLIHASTGRVAHVDSIMLDELSSNGISASEYAVVEQIATQLVQRNGSLMQDYQLQANYSATMDCFFNQQHIDKLDPLNESGNSDSDQQLQDCIATQRQI